MSEDDDEIYVPTVGESGIVMDRLSCPKFDEFKIIEVKSPTKFVAQFDKSPVKCKVFAGKKKGECQDLTVCTMTLRRDNVWRPVGVSKDDFRWTKVQFGSQAQSSIAWCQEQQKRDRRAWYT
jgi:hypothetical protein